MGMALFESSGVFRPANYGLNVGDLLHVICVGGGASGNGASSETDDVAGIAGGASSFGSLVSAAGGSVGAGALGVAPANTATTGTWSGYVAAGGDGQHGFLLNSIIPIWVPSNQLHVLLQLLTTLSSESINSGLLVNGGKTDKAGNGVSNGSDSTSSYAPATSVGGRGGLGYGAGGGGGAFVRYRYAYQAKGNGGGAGVIKHYEYKLTDTVAVPVTVGTGGAANSATCPGGVGAPGCVAVFW